MKELILHMPPHGTPVAVRSLEAAKQALMELVAQERAFAAMHRERPEHDNALRELRAQIADANRYIAASER